jgi:hypothetical protein
MFSYDTMADSNKLEVASRIASTRQGKLLTKLFFVIFLLPLAALAQTQGGNAQPDGARAQEQPREADAPARITLPPGTTISVRIADHVDSNHNHAGDLITGTVDPSVFLGDRVVIPRGTEAHVQVVEEHKGGHLRGKADVSLELVGLVINKEKLDVESDDYRKKQGALSAKIKGTEKASPDAGASAATSPNPTGSAAGPIIAVFRAAKIEMPAGTRIPFTVTIPFTFDAPPVEASTQH